MAESKRTFQAAKMNKDIDDRLLQPGTYRDALNVSVEFSEDGNVGALENLKGNEILSGQDILGLSSSSNPNAEVIGSYAHPEESKIYYFVTGDKTDGIFEYDISDPNDPIVSTIIVDSTEENIIAARTFEFSNAGVSGTIAQNGKISLTANLGSVTAITADFDANTSGSTKTLDIQARVRVPSGYANAGEYVVGVISATQPSQTEPGSVETKTAINVTTTTATIRGALGYNDVGVTGVGFYWGYNTGGTQLTLSELESGGSGITRNTVNISSFEDDFSSDITSIPTNKLISYVAFATNSTGTGEGDVKTFTTSDVSYNIFPDGDFIPTTVIASVSVDERNIGYGPLQKADSNYYIVIQKKNEATIGDTGYTIGPSSPAITFSTPTGAPSQMKYFSAPSTGDYTIPVAKSGYTTQNFTYKHNTANKTINLNLTGIHVASADINYYQYNASPNPLITNLTANPLLDSSGFSYMIVPLNNTATTFSTTPAFTSSFDGDNLTVSFSNWSGEDQGVNWEYYVEPTSTAIFGMVPGIILKVKHADLPLNSSTLNITYTT